MAPVSCTALARHGRRGALHLNLEAVALLNYRNLGVLRLREILEEPPHACGLHLTLTGKHLRQCPPLLGRRPTLLEAAIPFLAHLGMQRIKEFLMKLLVDTKSDLPPVLQGNNDTLRIDLMGMAFEEAPLFQAAYHLGNCDTDREVAGIPGIIGGSAAQRW